jgi:hypothetical protein
MPEGAMRVVGTKEVISVPIPYHLDQYSNGRLASPKQLSNHGEAIQNNCLTWLARPGPRRIGCRSVSRNKYPNMDKRMVNLRVRTPVTKDTHWQ